MVIPMRIRVLKIKRNFTNLLIIWYAEHGYLKLLTKQHQVSNITSQNVDGP